MSECDAVRAELALQPSCDDEGLRQHLETCGACAAYRRQHQALDLALRAELFWEAPPALTRQLLALVAPAARPRPPRWYVTTVYVLTLAATALSLLVAWQFLSLLVMHAGLDVAAAQLLAAPAQGLAQLTQLAQRLPESQYVIGLFLRVRDQLMWVMLIAVLWAALDKWSPQLGLRGRQVSS